MQAACLALMLDFIMDHVNAFIYHSIQQHLLLLSPRIHIINASRPSYPMCCLDGEGFHTALRSPLTKRPARRTFMRQMFQALVIAGIIVVVFFFGRDMVSPSNVATIDMGDIDLLQSSLCSNHSQQQQQHLITTTTSPQGARRVLSEYDMAQHLQPETSPDQFIPPATWQRHAVRGALYMVIRNENLQDARAAMRSVEDRFNKHYQYPWILLNNQDFSPTFRKFIRKVTDAPIFFGKTDMAAWDYPSWIDIPLAENKILDMTFRTALHMGGSLSFRKMLRLVKWMSRKKGDKEPIICCCLHEGNSSNLLDLAHLGTNQVSLSTILYSETLTMYGVWSLEQSTAVIWNLIPFDS